VAKLNAKYLGHYLEKPPIEGTCQANYIGAATTTIIQMSK
jgi:hypothetical protein